MKSEDVELVPATWWVESEAVEAETLSGRLVETASVALFLSIKAVAIVKQLKSQMRLPFVVEKPPWSLKKCSVLECPCLSGSSIMRSCGNRKPLISVHGRCKWGTHGQVAAAISRHFAFPACSRSRGGLRAVNFSER